MLRRLYAWVLHWARNPLRHLGLVCSGLLRIFLFPHSAGRAADRPVHCPAAQKALQIRPDLFGRLGARRLCWLSDRLAVHVAVGESIVALYGFTSKGDYIRTLYCATTPGRWVSPALRPFPTRSSPSRPGLSRSISGFSCSPPSSRVRPAFSSLEGLIYLCGPQDPILHRSLFRHPRGWLIVLLVAGFAW